MGPYATGFSDGLLPAASPASKTDPPDFAVLLHMSMPLNGFRTNHSPLRQTAIGILALPEQIEYLCPLLPGAESAFAVHPFYRLR